MVDPLSRALTRLLGQAAGVTGTDEALVLGARTLAVRGAVEQMERGPQFAVGIRVTCALDGEPVPALTAGSVGLGDEPEAAVQTAVQEWVMSNGLSIANALLARGDRRRFGTPPHAYDITASATGVRGQAPDGLGKLHGELLGLAAPAFGELFVKPSPLHALTVVVVRKPDAPLDGEFRVDGELSPAFRAIALRVAWPAGHDKRNHHNVLAP